MIRNLIWDVDGTLYDTYPAIARAFLDALESFGRSDTASHVILMARAGLSDCARVLAAEHDLIEDELAEQFAQRYAAMPKVEQVPFPGVKSVCRAGLEAREVNAIATHRARASIDELPSAHAMGGFFSAIAAGDEGYAKKPDPAALLAILERCNLDRRETAAVGDRDVGIPAGTAAGLTTRLFHSEASDSPAAFVFTRYADLLLFLRRS